MWRKWLIGLSVSTIFLAGCQEKETVDKQPKKEDEVFTIVIGKGDKIDLQEVESKLEGQFGLQVEIDVVSAKKKRQMVLEGKADIALLSPSEIGFAADEGALQKVDLKENTYLHAAVSSLQYEGEQYAIPGSFDVPLLVYNPSFYEEAPQSVEDMLTYANKKELAEKETEEAETVSLLTNEIVEPYAFYANMYNYDNIESVLHSYGTVPFKKDNGIYNAKRVYIDSEEAKQSLEKIAFLHNELIPRKSLNKEEIIKMYEESRVYSFIGTLETARKLNADMRVTTLPQLEEGTAWKPSLEVQGWAVMNTVVNKEIIQGFEEIVTSESFVRQQLEDGYQTPVSMTWEEENEQVATLYEQAEKSYAKPILAEWNELKTPLKNATKWYLNGNLSLEDALKTAKQTIEFSVKSNYAYE